MSPRPQGNSNNRRSEELARRFVGTLPGFLPVQGQSDSSVDRHDLRFATCVGQKLRPLLHQPPSALEQIRAGVGGPRLVPLHMGQCQINDFPGSIASLGRPAIEAGTKSMGYGSDAQLLEQVGQCRSRKRLSPGFGNTRPVPPVRARARSRISTARLDNGTRCSRAIFILLAGIVQSRSARSISFHRARRTSPERAAVNTRNSKASLDTSDASDSRTVRIAAATSS